MLTETDSVNETANRRGTPKAQLPNFFHRAQRLMQDRSSHTEFPTAPIIRRRMEIAIFWGDVEVPSLNT